MSQFTAGQPDHMAHDELDRWLVAAGYEPVDAFDEFAF
jgi:hypothetical protein